MKKFVALLLALTMVMALVPTMVATAEEAPKIVRIGTHWVDGEDPFKINETTGAYTITDESDRLLRVQAWEKVKEEMNVEIQFVQYAQDTQQELVLSVLAGNPVCDVAMMWNGVEVTVLGQNILQPLGKYADIFEGGSEWMLLDPVYGDQYFIRTNNATDYDQYFSLLVNLSMLEQVETLREEDGTILYPTEMLERGEWTWNNFRSYLEKIQAYYANTPAPDGAEHKTIAAYEMDYRFAALAAAVSNGGGIYSEGELKVASQETKDAVAYIVGLLKDGIAVDCGVYDNGYEPHWCQPGYDFGRGAAVFAECHSWGIGGEITNRTKAGDSVALMPFPRPDRLAFDDPAYQQVISVGDCWGVLKGIPEDQVRLALQAFTLYENTYYKLKGGVDDMADYKAATAEAMAVSLGLDILHPEVGEGVLNAFIYNADHCKPNDFAGLMGMRNPWDQIVGKGIYGIDGMPSYDVAIEANISDFSKVVTDMEAILGSTEIHDNQGPKVTAGAAVAIPVGTDITTIDPAEHFTAFDAFDGEDNPPVGTFDTSAVDTTTPGSYKLKGIFTDKTGNEGSANLTVVVYNPDNTTEPTLTLKAELPTIAMDTDASTISWKDKYVETATDADDLDLKDRVTADLSNLDTFTPGTYPVTLTVTDYAGNTASVEIEVTVVAE